MYRHCRRQHSFEKYKPAGNLGLLVPESDMIVTVLSRMMCKIVLITCLKVKKKVKP